MPSTSSVVVAGVAAVCTAFAVLALADAPAMLFAPAALQTAVRVAPATPVAQPAYSTRVAAVAEQAAADVNDLAVPVAQAQGTPLAALLAIPAALAAVFYAAGRFATRRPEQVGLMDIAIASTSGEQVSRRALLQTGAAAAASLAATPALAAIPSGFTFHKDPYDGYEFLYPFGWQEVTVTGQDVLYKDIIEPLETIGVTVTPTDKTNISELGNVQEVCLLFADKFLTPSNQTVKLIDAKVEESEGITYYLMEFVATAPTYQRHALAALAVCNGKLLTCLTGSNEKRWKKMEARLRTAIDSFTVFKVVRMTM